MTQGKEEGRLCQKLFYLTIFTGMNQNNSSTSVFLDCWLQVPVSNTSPQTQNFCTNECKNTTGIHIHLTRADFSSAEKFEKQKRSRSSAQWQQSAKTMIYHNIEKTDLYKQVCLWWTWWDSNPRPLGCEQAPETFFEHFRPFLAVSAPLHFIFGPLWPCCFRVVRGGVWWGLWSETLPSPCRCLLPTGTGSVFHISDCLHCTSESRMKQVISVPSAAQKIGGQ